MVHWQRSLDMKLPTDSTIEVFIFLGVRGKVLARRESSRPMDAHFWNK